MHLNMERVMSNGSPIAEVILAHAVRSGSDLLVLGAYSHSRLRELVLGGTKRTLLASRIGGPARGRDFITGSVDHEMLGGVAVADAAHIPDVVGQRPKMVWHQSSGVTTHSMRRPRKMSWTQSVTSAVCWQS